MKVELKHGAGGASTGELIEKIFAKHFSNVILNKMEDGAVLPRIQDGIVFTSDSFVVEPLTFPGGDIGRLAICGTVNDLASMGAQPRYLTACFILETGLDLELLEKIVVSMAATAAEAGVQIVAGDTKVIEGKGGLYINTAGIGRRSLKRNISSHNIKKGDKIIITGTLGDHHATILTQRLGLESPIQSDCAPLNGLVDALLAAGIVPHAIRDITRGGLATVGNELALASGVKIVLKEDILPISSAVRSLSGILGLDPLTMGNEGKLCIALPAAASQEAVRILRGLKYGENAVVLGDVEAGDGLWLANSFGGCRRLQPLQGEGLPRIC